MTGGSRWHRTALAFSRRSLVRPGTAHSVKCLLRRAALRSATSSPYHRQAVRTLRRHTFNTGRLDQSLHGDALCVLELLKNVGVATLRLSWAVPMRRQILWLVGVIGLVLSLIVAAMASRRR